MKKLIYLFVLLSATARADTFIEHHSILCGAVLELGAVGYPSWIEASIIQPPSHGQAFIFTTPPYPDSLIYKSDYGYLGQDTFIVACAHANQITCDTGIYIISVVGCPPILAFWETHEITCDSTLLVPGLGYPTWVTPQIVQPAKHGDASILFDSLLWHTLKYVPEAGFNGTDTVVVECAHATQITCETGIYVIHVTCVNAAGEAKTDEHWRVFPNPFDGNLKVEMDLPNAETLHLRLLDWQGSVVFSQKIEAKAGRRQVSLDLAGANLCTGNYVLEISGEDGLRFAQVVSHVSQK